MASDGDRYGLANGDGGAQGGAAPRAGDDTQGAAQAIEAVLHVGEPVAAAGGGDVTGRELCTSLRSFTMFSVGSRERIQSLSIPER